MSFLKRTSCVLLVGFLLLAGPALAGDEDVPKKWINSRIDLIVTTGSYTIRFDNLMLLGVTEDGLYTSGEGTTGKDGKSKLFWRDRQFFYKQNIIMIIHN